MTVIKNTVFSMEVLFAMRNINVTHQRPVLHLQVVGGAALGRLQDKDLDSYFNGFLWRGVQNPATG